MTWIKTIPPENADGKLADLYRRISGNSGQVDQILQVHSLRPHSLQGHMALYKAVLHHTGNKVPKQTLELIGVWVSWLNGCDYCVDHHFAGMCKLIGSEDVGRRMKEALIRRKWKGEFNDSVVAMLKYAEALTLEPQVLPKQAVARMAQAGASDGEILEVNQVVAYFNYANRTVLGLGVNSEGELLGTSPNNSEDESDWGHKPADATAGSNSAGLAGSSAGASKAGSHSLRSVSPYKPAIRSGYQTLHGRAMQAGNHIQTGSTLFDAFFRLTAGSALGCAIAMILHFGIDVPIVLENKWLHHPFTDGLAYGFLMSIPANILLFIWHRVGSEKAHKRKVDFDLPRMVGRPALVIAAIATSAILWTVKPELF
jgi:uncharacterized peroxidase-related enzyme